MGFLLLQISSHEKDDFFLERHQPAGFFQFVRVAELHAAGCMHHAGRVDRLSMPGDKVNASAA